MFGLEGGGLRGGGVGGSYQPGVYVPLKALFLVFFFFFFFFFLHVQKAGILMIWHIFLPIRIYDRYNY